MKHLFTLFLFVATVISLGACSGTLDGMGKDIERMGQTIQNR